MPGLPPGGGTWPDGEVATSTAVSAKDVSPHLKVLDSLALEGPARVDMVDYLQRLLREY